MNYITFSETLPLENGGKLSNVTLAYSIQGKLNTQKDNVVWVFHALTANANPAEWWDGLVGPGKLLDPSEYFIVCASMLGSCYGATNPNSINTATGRPYHREFPLITIRDVVRSQQLLAKRLGIKRVKLGIGGSMGGQQLLEWAIIEPDFFENIVAIATNARHSAWGIAFNEAQRMAIENDPSLWESSINAGANGLAAARAIAMISYRNYDTYQTSQLDEGEKLIDFKSATYQRYQGKKLSQRFDARSYLALTRLMDSHHVGRGRGGEAAALANIKARSLVIGIKSDVLFPVQEQLKLAELIPNAQIGLIDSPFGHDGFLIEYAQLNKLIAPFLANEEATTLLETKTEKGLTMANN